ncbi:MAG TPA: hypothetical protein GX707_13235 [Epulopiscium sp.]|nr:hypothetical protein [Candidatus Epulonipiscium sp.]
MKKDFLSKSLKKRIVWVSIVVVIILLYVSSQLSDSLNVFTFSKGVIGVELLNKDYVKLDEHVFFYKTGNITPLIEYYEVNGYAFGNQFGAGYIFYRNNKRFNFTTQAVTRRHSIMITK